MEARIEKDLQDMLEIAGRIIEDGRKPTEEERRRFLTLKTEVEEQDANLQGRWADMIDRLAAALESMGI